MNTPESLPKPIHIGCLIEQRLDAMGMTKAEFGRRINTSRQNVNSLLRKQSLDTALLQRIGAALDHNFFNYYADPIHIGSHGPDSLRRGEQSTKVLAAGLDVQTAIARLNVLLLGGG